MTIGHTSVLAFGTYLPLVCCVAYSTIDDPVVLSVLLPWNFFYTESMHGGNRWSLCAKEICYRNTFLG